MRESIRKCFIKTGCFPAEDGSYNKFTFASVEEKGEVKKEFAPLYVDLTENDNLETIVDNAIEELDEVYDDEEGVEIDCDDDDDTEEEGEGDENDSL